MIAGKRSPSLGRGETKQRCIDDDVVERRKLAVEAYAQFDEWRDASEYGNVATVRLGRYRRDT